MFYDFMWKESFTPGDGAREEGGAGTTLPPSPPFSTVLHRTEIPPSPFDQI